jgi:hypothetical protein
MKVVKQIFASMGLIGYIWLLVGCAEVVVPGAFTGAGEYYRYNTTNVAEQTLMATVDQIDAASREALKNMDIQLKGVESGDSKTEISAVTAELDIRVTMVPITATTTRVTVNAVEDHVIKDRATAAEILSQIKSELDRSRAVDDALPRIFVRNDCPRPIDVIVYCFAGKDEPQTWQTRGWFYLDAGQKKYVAEGHNRYVYFYGETRQAEKLTWAGDLYQWFEGKRYGFFKVDTGTKLVDFTQRFICD